MASQHTDKSETPHLEPEVLHIILPQADIQGQQLALKEMKNVGIVPPQEDNGSICELSGTPTMRSMPCPRRKTLHNYNNLTLCSEDDKEQVDSKKQV